MLCANSNIELVGEKNVQTDQLGPMESLLNHMDLDVKTDINTLNNIMIIKGMRKQIESDPANIIKVKKISNIETKMSSAWLRIVVGNK